MIPQRAIFVLAFVVAGGLPARAGVSAWSYWIEPCTDQTSGCRAGDPELARWALEAWQAASAGKLVLAPAPSREQARLRILWAGPQSGQYGETRPVVVGGLTGAEVYVRPAIVPPDVKDTLLRDAIVYLTCVHESGHAFGLAHTAAFADIMYSFRFGGDISEYFARYRRLLVHREDIRSHSGLSADDRARLRRAL